MTAASTAAMVTSDCSFVNAAPANAIAAMERRLATNAAPPAVRYATSIASAFPPQPENTWDAAIAAVQNAVASHERVAQRTTGTAASSHTADIAAAVSHGISCVKSSPHAWTMGTRGGKSTFGGGYGE